MVSKTFILKMPPAKAILAVGKGVEGCGLRVQGSGLRGYRGVVALIDLRCRESAVVREKVPSQP